MAIFRRVLLPCSAIAISIAACSSGSSTSNGANPDGGASGSPFDAAASSPDSSTASASLSCVGVLQCSTKCPDADVDACVQRCADQTTGKSHDVTMALFNCIVENACEDTDCTDAKCSKELDACLADVSEQGTPPTGSPPPTGSIPSGLVGTWSSTGNSTAALWTFEADGRTATGLEIDSSLGTCSYKTSVSSSGITTATADTFVYHRATGAQTLKKCGSTSNDTLGAADLTYRYELGPDTDGQPKLTLHVVNTDGTVSPTGTDFHH